MDSYLLARFQALRDQLERDTLVIRRSVDLITFTPGPFISERGASNLTLSRRIPRESPYKITFNWHDHETLLLRDDMGCVLRMLPMEIVHEILQQLNIASLARLQAVSRGLKRVVGGLPMLRAMLDADVSVISCIVATKCDSFITCRDLYHELCRPSCHSCNEAGAYLYLLACRRVCMRCLITRAEYRPLRPRQAAVRFCLDPDEVRRMPSLIVPKYMSRNQTRRSSYPGESFLVNTTGWRLLDPGVVARHSRARYGSSRAIVARRTEKLEKLAEDLPKLRRSANAYKPPIVEASLSAATPLPWLNLATGRVGRPVPCAACRRLTRDVSKWYFTEESFRKHEKHMGKVMRALHIALRREKI